MKLFNIIINYDSGGSEEYTLEARSESDAYDIVYNDLGYDPGEVYVEEMEEEA